MSLPTAGAEPLGVYVHYPWCRRLCPYCDFPVAVVVGPPPDEEYLAQLQTELTMRGPSYQGRQLRSIYLGGGTPSLWQVNGVASILSSIQQRFESTGPIEITLEANPIDCTPQRLAGWRAAGINRLSIGVQSLAADELVVLGRDHRFGDGAAAISAAVAAGFTAISADHILGAPVPGRRPAIDRTLPALADSGVNHLSVYELTIEPRTAFGVRAKAGRLVPFDDDTLADLYIAADKLLTARGFEHYEISSYAKPGGRAVHNSLYWSGAEFLGLGVGAASLLRLGDGSSVRHTNSRNVKDYLAGRRDGAELLTASARESARDRMWLAMRTSDGVAESDFAEFPPLRDWLVATELATVSAGRVRPTLRGFLMADLVADKITTALG